MVKIETKEDLKKMNDNFELIEVVERRKYHCKHCDRTFITAKAFTEMMCPGCKFGNWIPGKHKPITRPKETRLYFNKR